MKNTTFFALFVIALLIIGFIFVKAGNSEDKKITGDTVNNYGELQNGDTQKVVLGMKNFNYYPSEVRVKVSKPVSIFLEDNVFGCLRAVTIRELGIGKVLRKATDTLDFLPTQKGILTVSCSMGMGFGKIIVE